MWETNDKASCFIAGYSGQWSVSYKTEISMEAKHVQGP
jgi:hypothetical protein